MKKTNLFIQHLKNHAQFIDYNGCLMPAWYDTVENEYHRILSGGYFFELGSIGAILITGVDRDRLVDRLITKHVLHIESQEIVQALILSDNGRILEKPMVSRFGDGILLTIRRSRLPVITSILDKHTQEMSYQYQDLSDSTGKIAVCGQDAHAFCERLLNEKVEDQMHNTFQLAGFKGFEILLSRTRYYKKPGFEIFYEGDCGKMLWENIVNLGLEMDFKPCGIMAGEIVRIEQGSASFSREMSGNYPDEVGLTYLIDTSKPIFWGKEALEKNAPSRTRYQLAYLEINGKQTPKQNDPITDMYDQTMGRLSSCIFSLHKQQMVGMAFLEKDKIRPDMQVMIRSKNKYIMAQVVQTPFLNNE